MFTNYDLNIPLSARFAVWARKKSQQNSKVEIDERSWEAAANSQRLAKLAPKDALLSSPHYPYTQGLLSAVPKPNPEIGHNR